jgi:hypothetical protein
MTLQRVLCGSVHTAWLNKAMDAFVKRRSFQDELELGGLAASLFRQKRL